MEDSCLLIDASPRNVSAHRLPSQFLSERFQSLYITETCNSDNVVKKLKQFDFNHVIYEERVMILVLFSKKIKCKENENFNL